MTDPWRTSSRWAVALLLPTLLLASACEDENFPRSWRVEGLRLLAVQSEPPALAPGQSANLRALVTDADGDVEGASYRWSWCPARLPSQVGGECAIDETELADLGLDGFDFDLGDDPNATLEHAVAPALLETLCKGDAEAGFIVDCAQGFPISVELIVEHEGEMVTAHKEVRLLLDADAPAEHNPQIDDVTFARVPPGVPAGDSCADDGPCFAGNDEDFEPEDTEPFEADTRFMLGERYVLRADVPEDASEAFFRPPVGFETEGEDAEENLAISWFISSGKIDDSTTSFRGGSDNIERLRRNLWKLPKAGDEDAKRAQLYLVIRDERGGVSWVRRDVGLDR